MEKDAKLANVQLGKKYYKVEDVRTAQPIRERKLQDNFVALIIVTQGKS